jgi:hypothetical protein
MLCSMGVGQSGSGMQVRPSIALDRLNLVRGHLLNFLNFEKRSSK